ncbi:MAG: hypothetical protein HY234_04020 [Acidobacteria bacterium]|nr:hypothetical protein [Acidobacteriota bacterium]
MKFTFLAAVAGSFLSFLLLTNAQQKRADQKAQPYDDSEGYAVLSFVLEGAGKSWESKVIRVKALTDSEKEMTEQLDECVTIPKEFQAAAGDFRNKAKTRFLLQEKFSSRLRLALVGRPHVDTSDAARPPRTEKEMRDRLTGGTYDVSAVGFDETKTRAIVYVNYVCGGLCGGGGFHLLEKGRNGWREADGIAKCTWMY